MNQFSLRQRPLPHFKDEISQRGNWTLKLQLNKIILSQKNKDISIFIDGTSLFRNNAQPSTQPNHEICERILINTKYIWLQNFWAKQFKERNYPPSVSKPRNQRHQIKKDYLLGTNANASRELCKLNSSQLSPKYSMPNTPSSQLHQQQRRVKITSIKLIKLYLPSRQSLADLRGKQRHYREQYHCVLECSMGHPHSPCETFFPGNALENIYLKEHSLPYGTS